MAIDPNIRIDVIYGFIRLDSFLELQPDGSMLGACRVRKYDNKPSEPERLISDEIKYSGLRLVMS